MEEGGPKLTVIEGGLPKKDSAPQVPATTGLREGNYGMVLEKPGFVAGIRRSLSRFTSKFKISEDDWGKGF